MKRRTALSVAVASVAAVVLGGGAAAYGVKQAVDAAEGCAKVQQFLADSGDIIRVSEGSPAVAILGDSYSAGDALRDRSAGWVYELGAAEGWQTDVAGVGMTGYLNGGFCGHQAYSDRLDTLLALHPDVLIIQGGTNDGGHSKAEVEAAALHVFEDVSAVPTVIAVGPVDVPGRSGLDTVDAGLASAATATGVRYVSALNWDVEIGPDRVHMTERGHARYAALLAAALPAL